MGIFDVAPSNAENKVRKGLESWCDRCWSGVYLPFCRVFVTDDTNQRRALRIANTFNNHNEGSDPFLYRIPTQADRNVRVPQNGCHGVPLPTLPLSSQKEEGRADAEGKQCSQYSTEEFEGESVPALRSAAHVGDASSRGRRRRRNARFPAQPFKTGNGNALRSPGRSSSRRCCAEIGSRQRSEGDRRGREERSQG